MEEHALSNFFRNAESCSNRSYYPTELAKERKKSRFLYTEMSTINVSNIFFTVQLVGKHEKTLKNVNRVTKPFLAELQNIKERKSKNNPTHFSRGILNPAPEISRVLKKT